MFERYTDRARRTIVEAQQEAKSVFHTEVNTEHLLLGVLVQEYSMAVRVLSLLGIDVDAVRRDIASGFVPGESLSPSTIPFSDSAKRMMELALREALQLGHGYIGTEHLLLGIIRHAESPASEVLYRHGVNLNEARQMVLRQPDVPG